MTLHCTPFAPLEFLGHVCTLCFGHKTKLTRTNTRRKTFLQLSPCQSSLCITNSITEAARPGAGAGGSGCCFCQEAQAFSQKKRSQLYRCFYSSLVICLNYHPRSTGRRGVERLWQRNPVGPTAESKRCFAEH